MHLKIYFRLMISRKHISTGVLWQRSDELNAGGGRLEIKVEKKKVLSVRNSCQFRRPHPPPFLYRNALLFFVPHISSQFIFKRGTPKTFEPSGTPL